MFFTLLTCSWDFKSSKPCFRTEAARYISFEMLSKLKTGTAQCYRVGERIKET
jgi:hypothetical protein